MTNVLRLGQHRCFSASLVNMQLYGCWSFHVDWTTEPAGRTIPDMEGRGDDDMGVAVPVRSRPCGLEQTVEALQAGAGEDRGPALHHLYCTGLHGRQWRAEGLQPVPVADHGPDVVQEMADPPQRRAGCTGLADPPRLFLKLPRGQCVQSLFGHLRDREQLAGGEVVHVAALSTAQRRWLGSGFFPLRVARLVPRNGELGTMCKQSR